MGVFGGALEGSSLPSEERFIIGKLITWQDDFPLRATDTESLSLSVETRAVCKIRQEYYKCCFGLATGNSSNIPVNSQELGRASGQKEVVCGGRGELKGLAASLVGCVMGMGVKGREEQPLRTGWPEPQVAESEGSQDSVCGLNIYR